MIQIAQMQECKCDLNKLGTIAKVISQELTIGDVILLNGDLGTGKTTFTKLLVQHLGGNSENVTSPTFNLVHRYKTKSFDVWHFDLYRLKSKEELYNLGIDDSLMNGVCILEWGKIAKDFLPNNCIEIFFKYTANTKIRKIVIQNFINSIDPLPYL